MRPAKVPGEVVYEKVWASLCARMDPSTRRVRPSWIQMMREIGVCRQRIADTINTLKAEGKLEVVMVPKRTGDDRHCDYYYRIP
ncbi:MAG: hypothetical protein Q4G65_13845 [bacterium]|nr:hypothetical protein [bacterium]